MCPWVGPRAPSFGRQLCGLPSRVEYLSPQGILLPLVYGTTASPLWLDLRGLSASQATPSWTVYRLACHRLLPWLRVTFAMVPDAAWPGSDKWPWGTAPAAGPVGRLGRPSASDPWGVGSFQSLGRPSCARVCGVLGYLAPVHRCARLVCCVACAVSRATWLLFTDVPAPSVALRVRCPGPFGSCSPVFSLGALLFVCGVLCHLAPVHWCVRLVRCFACVVSWATWYLFTGVPAPCVVLRLRCPGPLGSCSLVCPFGVLLCVCGVLGHLAPVHRCARAVCCVGCAVSWATWFPFTDVPAWGVVLRVRSPWPLGSCSPVCQSGALLRVRGVPGDLAPVHRCARVICCVARAVPWATWLLFTGAPARCFALRLRCPGPLDSCSPVWPRDLLLLRVRCPGPLGSCSPMRPLGALLCVCGVLGHLAPVHRCGCLVCCCCACGVLGRLAPVHRCTRSVLCSACTVSLATWLLFTGVPAPCVVLCVRCPEPLGSCSPVCPRGLLCCVCAVLGHLAPVHRCARSVRCVACALSWATWLLFTSAPAWCVALRVRCPEPLSSCSLVCPLCRLLCVCGVLGHLAPVHRCARSVCCVAFAVSWASPLLFTGVPARCVVSRVRCPGPLGSCSPVCPLSALCCMHGVLGHLAPVQRCARLVCCVACAGPGPFGSCSPVCPLGVLCGVYGALGHLVPVHRCVRSVCCVACAVSPAIWLLFTGVPVRCVALRVQCPGPLGYCSPVCPRGLLCCACGVLGHLAAVHQCARSVLCSACAVSWATWLLFTGVPARCVVLRVQCPGPLCSCSPVRPLGVLPCVCGVLGHLAPVHQCARSVCCVACKVSWATWLLFTVAPAWCVALRMRCSGPLGSCSPVCPSGPLFGMCGVLRHLAPVHRCARSVRCVACAVSWATWLLSTGAPAWCVALCVRCPGPFVSCSPVCSLHLLCRVCGVLGHLAPVHRCARSVRCFAGAVSLATWLLFTGVLVWCFALRVRCPGPFGSCSPVCPLGALLCICGVLGHLAPVHRCARSVCCFGCVVSWASWLLLTGVPAQCVVSRVRCLGPLDSCSLVCPPGVLCCVCESWAIWLLFTGVPARCFALRVRCPGPPRSCSPLCPFGVLLCVYGVLGHLAPVHWCARLVRCFACAVSWAIWLLFTGVPAPCVALRLRCPGPPRSCSPLCPFGVLYCVYGVLGHLAPVHGCACTMCCVACAVSRATWLLFTGVSAWGVVLCVRCLGTLGSCSLVCPSGALLCVCGVLGDLAPVHRCARMVCCVARAVSRANWLLFTGAPARCFALRVRCPGPPGSCSPVYPHGLLCCACGVLGHLAAVHRCARSVLCSACAVSWASWLLFTGVPAWFVVLRARCPWPLGSCSPVFPSGPLLCVYGVLSHLAPVHRCAHTMCCVACAVYWAS